MVAAAILLTGYVLASATARVPPADRWAGLAVVLVIGLATTLQGSVGVNDWLGRTVRRDRRSLLVLCAGLPVLYLAYSQAINVLNLTDFIGALLFTIVPVSALWLAGRARQPTIFDLVAFLYLACALEFALVPPQTLPSRDGLVNFFVFALPPLLLLLLNARGWPGLGFSWYLNGRELRATVAVVAVLILPVLALAIGTNLADFTLRSSDALLLIATAITSYFFVALPTELLYRGMFQSAVMRWLTALGSRPALAGNLAIGAGALLAAGLRFPQGLGPALLALVIGLGCGWLYRRTGKITAAAAAHALLVWGVTLFQ